MGLIVSVAQWIKMTANWFRKIPGVGPLKYFFVPITWQGFLFDVLYYALIFLTVVFRKGFVGLFSLIIIVIAGETIKRSKAQTIKESLSEQT